MAKQSLAHPLPVLLTRPLGQGQGFALRLADRFGAVVRPVLSPLMAPVFLAPDMPRGDFGGVIFTSSTAGIYGVPYRAPYAAAKWAVIGLMKTVAMELGPFGIRANAICPGSVHGPRIDRVIDAEAAAKGTTPDMIRQGYASGTALKRLSDPEDVAHMALFLASDGARMVSGQALTVDGFTINPDP